MALAKIRQFITKNLDLLSTQLSKLEDNVANETADIRASFLDTLSDVRRAPTQAPFVASLAHGELLDCSTVSAMNVTLEAPSASIRGRMAGVIKGGGTVTMFVEPPNTFNPPVGLVNAANGVNLSGGGFFLFVCDGKNWWFRA